MTNDDKTVGIVGGGQFGTALAQVIANAGRSVLLWTRSKEVCDQINQDHVNPRLPETVLSPRLHATTDPGELAHATRFLVLAVAPANLRTRASVLGDAINGSHMLLHTAATLISPHDRPVSELLLEETPALQVGTLAGPALWNDLLNNQFTSLVAASRFDAVTADARRLLSAPPVLRVYRGSDMVGVELAAALAGAYTIAVAMSDELGVGPVPRAVLITRALAEASRLGQAMGAETRTFTGLAGLGTLLVRTSSELSANSDDYRLGRRLGTGHTIEEHEYSEGAQSVLAGARLATRLGVRMPVLRTMAAVITGQMTAAQAANAVAETVALAE